MKEGHRDRDRRSSWRKGRRRTLPFLLAALLLGGWYGGIAGAVGMTIGDLLDPVYVTVTPKPSC